jgi:hypothetical protein
MNDKIKKIERLTRRYFNLQRGYDFSSENKFRSMNANVYLQKALILVGVKPAEVARMYGYSRQNINSHINKVVIDEATFIEYLDYINSNI